MTDDKTDTVKVIIAFDRDNSKIGKTESVTPERARTLIAEGRARLASDKGNDDLRRPPGPTVTPPQPEVIAAADQGAPPVQAP